MNLKNLSEADIKKFAYSDIIYERAYDYYQGENIKELHYFPHCQRIRATVSGSCGYYILEINDTGEKLEGECNCPFDKYPCKHIIAVLLEFCKNLETYRTHALLMQQNLQVISEKINLLDRQELNELIINACQEHPELLQDLSKHFKLESDAQVADYLQQIHKLFPRAENLSYTALTEAGQKMKDIYRAVDTFSIDHKLQIYWAMATQAMLCLNHYWANDEFMEEFVFEKLLEPLLFFLKSEAHKAQKVSIIKELETFLQQGNSQLINRVAILLEKLKNS